MKTKDIASDSRSLDGLPAWVKASWLTMLVLGILMLALGALLVLNLAASVNTLRWLVFCSLALGAVQAFGTASLRARRWVGLLVGVAYVAGALIAVLWPGATLFALVLTVGISLLCGGLVQTGMALRMKREAAGWTWSFSMGVLSVVAGLVFLFGSPAISVAVLAIILAVHVVTTGVTLIALAFAIRGLAAAATASHTV